MLNADTLREKYAVALPYDRYVATGSESQRQSWRRIHEQASLTDAQRTLVASFTRRMPVLILSGTWCGDCAQQCPLIERIAEASPRTDAGPLIETRYLDRDEHRDLSDAVRICGGNRVPSVLFMAEDFEFCGLLGDRTLSRYRAVAARQLGPSCPLPGAPVPDEELAATLQDWLDEFERIHLMLRLSPRLREMHND